MSRHGRLIAARRGQPAGDVLRILYGGRVKPDNLNGGASLKADSFLKLVRYDRQ